MLAISSQHKRRKLGLVRNHRGQQPSSWEQQFVEVWGNDWWQNIRKCRSLAAWVQQFPDFRNRISSAWKVHMPCNEPNEIGQLVKRIKLCCSIDDAPVIPHNEKELEWNAGSQRVWIQTDNQLLEKLFSGQALLQSQDLRPICIRIGRLLRQMLLMGCLPRLNTVGFIEWDERGLNTLADHAANVTLDLNSDWEHMEWSTAASKSNIRICVDGALRGNGLAAGGMAVFAYTENVGRELVMRAGKHFGHLDSAFLAEASALEWALEVLISNILL